MKLCRQCLAEESNCIIDLERQYGKGVYGVTMNGSSAYNIYSNHFLRSNTYNTIPQYSDTGINWDHFDFNDSTNDSSYVNSRIKGGYDYTDNSTVYSKRDMDEFVHGTRMASIIGAKRNNTIGMAGIAGGNNTSSNKGVSLFAIKTAKNEYASSSITDQRLADALVEGATSHNSSSGYGYGLHVMNFSFKGDVSKISQNAYRFCYVNAVCMVAASGNDGKSKLNYPASFKHEWILKVGASNENSQWASFSTYGYHLDFVAPGMGYLYPGINYSTNTHYVSGEDGTSSACAHASGAAALLVSYINNNSLAPNLLWPEDVEHILQRTAKRIVPYDTKIGYGKINVGQALSKILLPKYQISHYNQIASNGTNTDEGVGLIHITQDYGDLASGYYYGRRFKISSVLNITQPAGRTILDVWPRPAISNVWSVSTGDIIPENHATVTSYNSTSATIVGYTYHFTSTLGGAAIDYWYPTTLSGTTSFNLSVYSYYPVATDITSATINDDMVTLYPNPTNDAFTLTFGVIDRGDVKIDVLNMGGQIVKSILKKDFEQQHFETKIDLSGQPTGMYICRIQTINGVISRKITLIH